MSNNVDNTNTLTGFGLTVRQVTLI